MPFSRTAVRRGAQSQFMIAAPHSGKWFNPPYMWSVTDYVYPCYCIFGPPTVVGSILWKTYWGPNFSHYVETNYYPMLPYTKEFIHKYKRMERWRHY